MEFDIYYEISSHKQKFDIYYDIVSFIYDLITLCFFGGMRYLLFPIELVVQILFKIKYKMKRQKRFACDDTTAFSL